MMPQTQYKYSNQCPGWFSTATKTLQIQKSRPWLIPYCRKHSTDTVTNVLADSVLLQTQYRYSNLGHCWFWTVTNTVEIKSSGPYLILYCHKHSRDTVINALADSLLTTKTLPDTVVKALADSLLPQTQYRYSNQGLGWFPTAANTVQIQWPMSWLILYCCKHSTDIVFKALTDSLLSQTQ